MRAYPIVTVRRRGPSTVAAVARLRARMSEVLTGTTKWFNSQKGYGFIQMPNGGLDIFIHANQLRKSGILRSLVEGEQVCFVVSQGPKGQYATDIKLVKEG